MFFAYIYFYLDLLKLNKAFQNNFSPFTHVMIVCFPHYSARNKNTTESNLKCKSVLNDVS
jgi:hypothetical protein